MSEILSVQVDTPSGRVDSKYQALELLGRGGMGQVHRVRHIGSGEIRAIKRFLGHLQTREQLWRFEQEIQALCELEHDNVVRIYEFGRCDGDPCFVMEYCSGGSLAARLKGIRQEESSLSNAPLPQPLNSDEQNAETLDSPQPKLTLSVVESSDAADPSGIAQQQTRSAAPTPIPLTPTPTKLVLQWSLELSGALKHVHENGRIHRDLKPANVLLTDSDVIKVADFGLVKALDAGRSITAANQLLGTPAYFAPEQAASGGSKCTLRSDIYSFGLILYKLLTGCHPYPRILAEPEKAAEIILQSKITPPARLDPRISADLSEVCEKCLEKDPEFRYASASELHQDLLDVQNGDGPRRESWKWLRRTQRLARRHPKTAAALSALAVGCVALGLTIWAIRVNTEEQLEDVVDHAQQLAVQGDHDRALDVLHQVQGRLSNSIGYSDLRRRVQLAIEQSESIRRSQKEQTAFQNMFAKHSPSPLPLTVDEAVKELEEISSASAPYRLWSLRQRPGQLAHQLDTIRRRYLTICKMHRLRPFGGERPWAYVTDGKEEGKKVLVVDRVEPDSVAASEGIQPGDTLLKVDGRLSWEVIRTTAPEKWVGGEPETTLQVELGAATGERRSLALRRGASGKLGLAVWNPSQLFIQALGENSPLAPKGIQVGDIIAYLEGEKTEKFDETEQAVYVMAPALHLLAKGRQSQVKLIAIGRQGQWKPVSMAIGPDTRAHAREFSVHQLAFYMRQELTGLTISDPPERLSDAKSLLKSLENAIHQRWFLPWERDLIQPATQLLQLDSRPLYVEGVQHAAAGRNLQAIEVLNRHLVDFPQDADAKLVQVYCYLRLRNMGGLIQLATELIADRPFQAMGYRLRSQAHAAMRQRQLALEDLQRAVELNIADEDMKKSLKELQLIVSSAPAGEAIPRE